MEKHNGTIHAASTTHFVSTHNVQGSFENYSPTFVAKYLNAALTCSGSSYSFGNIYHIDDDGLDAITLALNLSTEARHLVAVECIAHAAVYVHTPHFEDEGSNVGVVPVATARVLAAASRPQLILAMMTMKMETTATRTWRKQRC